jgi:hypothetical protein
MVHRSEHLLGLHAPLLPDRLECVVCCDPGDAGKMLQQLLCDGCDCGFHIVP